MTHHNRTTLRALAALTLLAPSVYTVNAANSTWNGNTDANLATASNWSINPTTTTNTWVFGVAGSSGTTLNNNLTPSQGVAGMTFNTGGAYTIGGNAINLTGNVTLSAVASAQSLGMAMDITSGATRSFSVNANTLTLGGVLSGTTATAAQFNANSSGTIELTNANSTYTGRTQVRGTGLIKVVSLKDNGTNSSFGNSGIIDLQGSLVYTGTGDSTNRVVELSGATNAGTLDQSGSGLLKFTSGFTATGAGSKNLFLRGSSTGTGEISGAIVDNSITNKTSLSKSGTGTWTLSGTNDYTGTTTVTGGTLLVNGSTSTGNVAVNTGAILGGSGTVGGATTIANGAFLAAGNSPGQLNFGSSLTLNATSTTTMELAGNGGVAGTDFDKIAVTGAITFNGTLNIVSFSGYDLNQTASYDLFDFGSSAGNFANVSVASTTLTRSLGIWAGSTLDGSVNYSFNQADGILTVSAVPEPSTYAVLAGLGILGFAVYRRRRAA